MRMFGRRRVPRLATAIVGVLCMLGGTGIISAAAPPTLAASAHSVAPHAFGMLDCNGHSPVQATVKPDLPCTDVRGFLKATKNNWNSRFYDNGHYIGHDEPDMTFLSSTPGSGNNVTWNETLGTDPSAAPTDQNPGSDVSHWFQLSVAPWYSMAMCDGSSYPQLPCTPNSDSNAATASYAGGGSAFMELQFYPPGFAPFADATSCDNSHWCAALTIDSLECTYGFVQCNPDCVEPVNFAFISRSGQPAGPPSPQLADLQSYTPNADTLLMNPGDKITVHMFDAPAPAADGSPPGSAFEVVVHDLTTGQTGSMQASAANGFMNTSIANCSGTPFNFQPEFNTAKAGNYVPWAALQTDISTEYEIGHWTSCSSLSGRARIELARGVYDTFWSNCSGPYESTTAADVSPNPETTDAFCYPAGDHHGKLKTSPDVTTGCLDFLAGGDLDFDGSPYWTEWPTGTQAGTYPGSFVEQQPSTASGGYSQFFMQTDTALSESTCSQGNSGCAIPPQSAPGKFYPYWSRVPTSSGQAHGHGHATPSASGCMIEFGNVQQGNTYGGDAQYGTDQYSTLGYDEFESPLYRTSSC